MTSLVSTICKVCKKDKPIAWDCSWDRNHHVCESCSRNCSRCGRHYCDECSIVLVMCETCDGIFCPTCKPRVCVCIVPRLVTCFMINFKSNNRGKLLTGSEDDDVDKEFFPLAADDIDKKRKRQQSDSTTTTDEIFTAGETSD